MRDCILIYVNGQRHIILDNLVLLSLSDFLRHYLGLIGTKIVCSEGDCGSCTVLVGRPCDGRMVYRTIDSCIQFMFQLDGAHVVTVEGLQDASTLHPVQQAMVDCHGSQCGFCTPGFVMAMADLYERCDQLDEAQWRDGLTGNLCRCTGYTAILEAGCQTNGDPRYRVETHYPSGPILDDFAKHTEKPIEIRTEQFGQEYLLFSPVDLEQALDFLKRHPDATIVAGATDLGVRINKSGQLPTKILDLNRIGELSDVEMDDDKLIAGAQASWTTIEDVCEDRVPEFHKILTIFGSPQIRNAGTIGGNIANASPIADSLPFLHVAEAVLELASASGTRKVNINDFYLGYKQFDLQPGELIARVEVPLPEENELLRLYKVSRRRDLDIASFTAAVRMRLDGKTIVGVSLAFGAVGPTIIRPRQTEAFLLDKPLTEKTMREAGDIATGEITPISDVRGSAEYRYQLSRNVLLKFFHETQMGPCAALQHG